MKTLFQRTLLGLYRFLVATKLPSTRAGRMVFEAAYNLYKLLLEAGPIHRLADFIEPDTWVVDVGANIGFFTVRFAKAVRRGGRVIAIEPERTNYDSLVKRLHRQNLAGVVDVVQAAATNHDGTTRLEFNPIHPGDHKLAIDDGGETVKAVTVDTLLAKAHWPRVSLIKIDVEGAEPFVLEGALGTIDRFHPAMFIEIDDKGLQRLGSNARRLIESVAAQGYSTHLLRSDGASPPLSVTEALGEVAAPGSYGNLLFLPEGGVPC